MRFALAVLSILSSLAAQEVVRRPDVKAPPKQAEGEAFAAIIKGQCVDGETGEPLAGCTVKVRPWGRAADDIPKILKSPPPVVTGPDGKFSIRVVAHQGYQVGFDASLPGCWPRTGRWRHMVAGEVEDLGKVELHKGVQVVGVAVDEQGKPVKGASIAISDLGLYLGATKRGVGLRVGGLRFAVGRKPGRAMHSAANGVRYCNSGDDGKFFGRESLPSGTFPMRISNRNMTLVRPQSIKIPEKGPMESVTIVVREEPYISGTVLDEQGQPVQGIGLRGVLNRSGRMASGRTRADGTFKIYRVENCPDKVRIRVSSPGDYEIPEETKEFAWGTSGVKIVVKEALVVGITVVEAESGKPVTNYAIRSFELSNSFDSYERRIQGSGHHEEGKLDVAGVRRGKHSIHIIPKDTQLQCVFVNVVAEEDMKPLQIELPRLKPMLVQVLDANGAPVANAKVLVIAPGNQNRGATNFNDPRSENMGLASNDPEVIYSSLICRAVTDGGGQCIAYGVAERDDMRVGVRLADGTLQVDSDVAWDGGGHTIKLKK